MEKKSILEKLKSKYTFELIFKFIKDENYKYKLFIYSKLFQKKLLFDLFNYQELYINKRINLNDYLSCFNNDYQLKYSLDYDKNILNKKLQKNLINNKIDIEVIKSYAINYFKKYLKDIKLKNNNEEILIYNNPEINIDIYSPFFDVISKTEIFEEIFTIPISIQIIEKYNLSNDFKSFFDNMNKNNIKYSSLIFNFKDFKDIKYFGLFDIKLEQIKRITIKQKFMTLDNINNFDINYFLNILLSFNNFDKNLQYLNIDLEPKEIEPNFLENLNNFKLLKQLELNGFIFKKIFNLKIPTLKVMILNRCENISFSDDTCLNLKVLILNYCQIYNTNTFLKFPKLEEFKLDQTFIYNLSIMDAIIDSPLLEKVSVNPCYISYEMEKIIFEKLISIKSLKYIDFSFQIIKNENFLEIIGENDTCEKFKIIWNNYNNDCILNKLQEKFLNLNEIEIYIPFKYEGVADLKINENLDCKINKFTLNGGFDKKIQFFINSYSNLVKAEFNIDGEIKNLKDVFPIFDNDSKIIFKSLIYFKFKNYSKNISFNYMKNIYINIDNMPNLKHFILNLNIEQIDNEFYQKFIKKILSLKLENINIIIKEKEEYEYKYYSLVELKEINPIINCINFNKIFIQKLNK